ncbi:MAG: ergothioneine biosynthesis protein EgtC, partial [Acidimicrobiales bacterium]|nr:ergothioneine biosynthesis protein EgtC [Acidimicrobiales bacterium]
MCRLLAYIGPRVSVQQLLYGQPYSLLRQSYAPRKQRHGRVNADGWGVGWYDFRIRPEPARYRTAQPMWADARFPEIAPLLTSELILAAVRDATPGAPVEESGAPPFLSGRFLFAHNGVIDGFRDGLGIELRRSLPTEREGQIIGTSDSEVVFALLLDRIDKGREPIEALVDVIHELDQLTTGRFNFVLTDGHEVLATTAGDSLYVLDGHSVTTTAVSYTHL